MDFFQRLSLKLKLVLTLGVIIGVNLISTGVLLWNESKNSIAADDLQGNQARLLNAQAMNVSVIQVQQYLQDVSATRALDGLGDGFEEAAKYAAEFKKGLDVARESARSQKNSEEVNKLNELQKRFEEYFEYGNTMAKAYVKGGPEEGNKLMEGFDKKADALQEALAPFVKSETDRAAASILQVKNRVHLQNSLAIGSSIFLLVFGVLIIWAVVRSINAPIERALEALSESIELSLSSSEQISHLSQSLAQGAANQAAEIESASASMQEIASMSKSNAANTTRGKDLAGEATQKAEAGQVMLRQMSGSLSQIKTASVQMRGAVEKMQGAQNEVSKIVKSIDEIAFQTNLLALNAAVEAARAGEAGAGFAVVADEVRSLAQRSAQAAKDTAAKIEESIATSHLSVSAAELLNASIAEIDQRSEAVNKGFEGILETVASVNSLIAQIAGASHEQELGISQFSHAVEILDKTTQANSEHAAETASAAKDLEEQSLDLQDTLHDLEDVIKGTAA